MTRADKQLVAALRKLTDLPWMMCHQSVVEVDGDITAAIQRLRLSSFTTLRVSDTQVAAELATHGITWVPPEPTPRQISDAEVVAELTDGGKSVLDYFLLARCLCFHNLRGELMARIIEDDDLAIATKHYLLRAGVPEYGSIEEYRVAHPNESR